MGGWGAEVLNNEAENLVELNLVELTLIYEIGLLVPENPIAKGFLKLSGSIPFTRNRGMVDAP